MEEQAASVINPENEATSQYKLHHEKSKIIISNAGYDPCATAVSIIA